MPVTKKPTVKKVEKPAKSGLTIDVVDMKGKVVDQMSLPKDVFGVVVSDQLLAQAMHVYRTNQRQGTVATKTRGKVAYSTRKIYKQKGTGRARHGSRKAPIFVGGGITFGPHPRDFELKLSKSQRKKALFGALSRKLKTNDMVVVTGVEKMKPKTKNIAQLLAALQFSEKSTLIGVSKNDAPVVRAARNIARVTVVDALQFNTYDVVTRQKLIVTRAAIEQLSVSTSVQK